MSPMAAAMLSSQPIALLNTAVGSALFYLRRPHGCTSSVLSIHRQHSSLTFPGANWPASYAILSNKVVAAAPSPGSSDDKPPSLSSDPLSSASETENDGVTNHGLPAVVDGDSTSRVAMHGSCLRVAYEGVPGAYSETAVEKAYPNCKTIPCDHYEKACQAVELGIADRAVLPLEKCIGGIFPKIARHRLYIIGEVQLPVHHCLLALPGVRKEHLTRVFSHPLALTQCERTLTALGRNVFRVWFDDTAGAAQYVVKNELRHAAAIASARAAELYGLQVLSDGIQDDSINITRFVILARELIITRTGRPFKTCIVFEGASVFPEVLSLVHCANLGFRLIGQTRNRAHDCEYYVDLHASLAEPRVQNVLAEIQKLTASFRVLGCYPVDMTYWASTSSSSSTPQPPSSPPRL